MASILSDAPIASPDDERFGRESFANSLADIIHNAPQNASFRIGVYGEWGEGKTSVLSLMARRLTDAGEVAVWLPAWMGRTREEVLERLVEEMATQVGLPLTNKKTGTVKKGATVVKTVLEANAISKAISAAVSPFISEALEKWGAESLQNLLNKVREHLGTKKIVVFVDDLDRAQQALVPDLLMSLRQIFDVPGMFFVLALSPSVITHGLAKTGFGGERPSAFLDKIIELPMQLPRITDRAIHDFIDAIIESLPATIDRIALRSLVPLLPSNPRRIKLFVRYLASASAVWGRFLPAEVDWRTLYVVQMLMLEYPEQARRLSLDHQAIDRMEFGRTREGAFPTSGAKNAGTVHYPEEPYAESLIGDDKARFLALCAAIRERTNVLRGRYRLEQLFHFVDSPPLVSWKELADLLTRYSSVDAGKRSDLVREWLRGSKSEGIDSDRARAAFEMTLSARDSAFDAAIEADTPSEIAKVIEDDALPLGQLARTLAVDLELFKTGVFGFAEWKAFVQHVIRWSAAYKMRQFAPIVGEDANLLQRVAADLSVVDQFMVIGSLHLDDIDTRERISKHTKEALSAVHATFQKQTTESLLAKFTQEEGLEAYWSVGESIAGKGVLFTPKSPFHAARNRKQLGAIARRARKESIVHLNFLTYFRMLTYGAFKEGRSFVQMHCRELLKDAELVRLVWTAAVASPLNPRIAGSMREDRKRIIAAGVPEAELPVPRWLHRLEETYFTSNDGVQDSGGEAAADETPLPAADS